jgi:hypothetical protein
MTGFDLPTNYIDDPEALLKRTRAKLKKVLALKSEDNHIRRSLTLKFEAMANKNLCEFSAPTTANICTRLEVNVGEMDSSSSLRHQHGASQSIQWKGT